MLPTSPLFSPGAMNPTPGMAMSPLLQGFGAGQQMQNDFTNTALNQQSQDIQNQTAQNTLNQQLLDNPNLAAARQVTAGNTDVQQRLLDSGQQLASQGAQLDAKTQGAIASMSDSKLEVLKNKGAAFLAADEYLKQDPSAEMPGSSGNKHLRGILEDAGVGGMPDVIGPQEVNFIKARAASAPNTLQFIQQTQLQKQKTAGEAGIEAQKAASAQSVAGIQAAAHVAGAEISANASRTPANLAAKYQVAFDQEAPDSKPGDPGYVNANQVATLQANLVHMGGPLVESQWLNQLSQITADPKLNATQRAEKIQEAYLAIPLWPEYEKVKQAKLKLEQNPSAANALKAAQASQAAKTATTAGESQQQGQNGPSDSGSASPTTPAAAPTGSAADNPKNLPVANAQTWAAAKSGDILWNASQKRYVTK